MTVQDKRTSLLKKNIIFSFLIKGWGGLVYLLLIAVTLRCLGVYENGIWMTISSIVVWIDMMDIGLGNGLRNVLATEMAMGDYDKARESVSTTFFMLIMIVIPMLAGCLFAITNIDLFSLLNVDKSRVPNLEFIVCVTVAVVCVSFVFKFVCNVFMALQLPAVSNALVVGGQTLGLVLSLVLYLCNVKSLMLITLFNVISPLIIYVAAYFITFGKVYPFLRPSLKFFRRSAFNSLFSLGVKFFILQIAGLMIFASSNVVISNLFSPSEVTNYQVVYRYYAILNMLFVVVSMPYWSATTDAYERGDWLWITSSMKRVSRVVVLCIIVALLMVLVASPVYKLWVGGNFRFELGTNMLMAFYILLLIFSRSYSTMLNGMGKLKLQLIFTSIAAVAFIPTVLLLYKPLGLNGIIAALILVNTPGAVVNALQFRHVVKNSHKKIK